MATINGTHTRNTSRNLSFYVKYSVTDEPDNCRLKVTATAYMKTSNAVFSHESSCSMTLKIGSTTRTISWPYLSCSVQYHEYSLGSITAYYYYSTSNTSVRISASTTDLTADGYGPGVCSASSTITVATGCSLAGKITATVNGEDSVTLKLTGLKSTCAYRRTVNWWYKPASSSTWTKKSYRVINKNAAAGTPSVTISGLIPGKAYNFSVILYAATASYPNYIKIYEKLINATTSAASGSIALSNITTSGMTATVTGLKSTTSYARSVKFYYKTSSATKWTLASTKSIAANTTAGSQAYTFKGLASGTKYNVKAELLTGTTVYRTLGSVSCSLPYKGVSVPQVTSVTQTSPSATITIAWKVKTVYPDTIDTTSFKLYIERANGKKILVGTYRKSNLNSSNAMTVNYNASGWMLAKETVSVYVVASHPSFSKTSSSNEIEKTVTRYFYWNVNATKGDLFNLAASDWNSMKTYVNAAHALYPNYFDQATYGDVAAGEPFTAVMANSAVIGGTAQRYGDVLASFINSIQSSLQTQMKRATGL